MLRKLAYGASSNLTVRKEDNGRSLYISQNSDPQIQLLSSNGRVLSLRPGTYVFCVQIEALNGAVTEPCIYLDYGSGYFEVDEQRFVARQVALGRFLITIRASRAVRSVRFDPSRSKCSFYLSTPYIVSESTIYMANGRNAAISLAGSVLRRVPKPRPEGAQEIIDDNTIDLATLSHSYDFASYGKNDVSSVEVNYNRRFLQEYQTRVYNCEDGRSYYEYAGLAVDEIGPVDLNVKTIAFYLPQMHPIKENDAWWGKGFTEWTNVSKAVPRYSGHHQPRLPGELGHYDLRTPETMKRQVELARLYGLSAFCFYFYWFSGKRLLERPLDMFVRDPSYDIEFCICWANENWTRRWDGLESDVLIAQNYTEEDVDTIFADWLAYIKDRRYLTIAGRPCVLIYRPDLIPNIERACDRWRVLARENGLDGLYLVAAQTFGHVDASATTGFDALYEFPPHNVRVPHIDDELEWFDDDHRGHAFSYRAAVNYALKTNEAKRDEDAMPCHPGVLVGWDTEARKPGRGDVMHGATPMLFRTWLQSGFERAIAQQPPDRQLVFINAWNEWAEGAYLEPDRRHGYAFLTALRSVVRQFGLDATEQTEICALHNRAQKKKADKAILLHLFYYDLLEEIRDLLASVSTYIEADLILTLPETWSVDRVKRTIDVLHPTKVLIVANRGRDILPFLTACRSVAGDGYKYICKIHSKKSTHRVDGNVWRNDLYSGLLSRDAIKLLDAEFFDSDDFALAAPASSILPLSERSYVEGNRIHFDNLCGMFALADYQTSVFVAGSMFWCEFERIRPIFESALDEEDFGIDLGQVDGTLAHAFERLFALFVERSGKHILKMDSTFKFDIKRR